MYKPKKAYFYGTGRRKSSVARVRLIPGGTGHIVINNREIDNYFGLDTLKTIVRQPLEAVGVTGQFDLDVKVQRRWFHRPSRRHPLRPGPRPAASPTRNYAPHPEEGRVPDPRPQNEGAQEVRPQGCPPRAPVLQALIIFSAYPACRPHGRQVFCCPGTARTKAALPRRLLTKMMFAAMINIHSFGICLPTRGKAPVAMGCL